MIRWLVRVVGLVLLGGGVLLPGLLSGLSSSSSATEETTIRQYAASFDLHADGELQVTERLTVAFPATDKHGIFRFWDIQDANATHARRVPHDISVTRDGNTEPVSLSWETDRRYRVAKIGDADVYVPAGDHVYVISYVIDGVLLDGPGATSSFYWNLVPGGWQQAIDRATLTVHLPAEAQGVKCAVGNGSTTGCKVSGAGTTTVTVRASGLPPKTPVTLQAGLDVPTPAAGNSVPWPYWLDGVFGTSVAGAGAVVGLAALLGLGGGLLGRRTHETEPPFPLQYAPPDGIGPAQAAYILTEQVDRPAFVASVMHAAERGAVTLDRAGDGWAITDRGGAEGWVGLDDATREVGGLLTGPHTSFAASRSSVTAGKSLQSAIGEHTSAVKSWATRQGLIAPAGMGAVGALLVVAAVGLTIFLIVVAPGDIRGPALVPGLFALGGIELVGVGASTKRTPAGRDLWSRIGGFRRILSTPSSVDRFEFSGREDLYTAYLPWAVAFGCAANWADKFRTEMGAEPPAPAYFGAYAAGYYGGDPSASPLNDFSATVDSAISAYQATQTSSSSGGGGFSGGGGGGGGGGGSW